MILICGMFLLSCQVNPDYNKEYPSKFKEGDIVYMKPDSTKCVVSRYNGNPNYPCYAVKYTDKLGVIHETRFTEESLFY